MSGNHIDINNFLLLSKYLIITIHYKKQNNICFSLVTKHPDFYKSSEKYNFYDLIAKKQVYYNLDDIFEYYMQFADNINIKSIFDNTFKLNNSELKKHLEYNIEFAKKFNQIKTKEIRNITSKFKNKSLNEILEECSEVLFFTPKSTLKEEIIQEMKERKSLLLQAIDGGVIEKITSIFQIMDEDLLSNDPNVITNCKEKWKGVINFYVNKALTQLDKELEVSKIDNNYNDLKIEVTEIKNILKDSYNEIEIKEFKSPKDIASYWPDILMPSPLYVLKKSS
jgi:hypothetical protein